VYFSLSSIYGKHGDAVLWRDMETDMEKSILYSLLQLFHSAYIAIHPPVHCFWKRCWRSV